MAEYVSAPILVDPDDLLARVFSRMTDHFAGWQPAEGNLDYWLAEAFAQIAASIAEGASDVPPAIFRYFGAKIAGIPPIPAAQASGTTTWTMADNLGYTVPEGTTVGFGDVAFQTSTAFTVPAGQTVATGVPVLAVDAGSDGNGQLGDGALVDDFAFVDSVALEGETAGGDDGESDADYLDRLAEELRLLSPRPILAKDFAVLARRVAGVGRATALDNYDPATPGVAVERAVTVALATDAGEVVDPAVKATVDALLQGMRETNFLVYVVDPTYTTVYVTGTVSTLAGYDPAAVAANVTAALEGFLSPASWGQPALGETTTWTNETKVRYLDLAAAAKSVEGVRHVESLNLGTSPSPTGTADVTLTGAVPMPRGNAVVTPA